MNLKSVKRTFIIGLIGTAFTFVAGLTQAQQTVGIKLTADPEEIYVDQTTEVDLVAQFSASGTGPEINAYDTHIIYDSNKLTWNSASDAGCIFKNACGSTFLYAHLDEPGDLLISHAILCANTVVKTNGILLRLIFTGVGSGQLYVKPDDERTNFYRGSTPVPVGDLANVLVTVLSNGGNCQNPPCELEKPVDTWTIVKTLYRN